MNHALAIFVTTAFLFSSDLLSAAPPVEKLLQKYCLGCHNENDREAGLSLQTPESIKLGSDNGVILNSSEPSKGLLYQVLSTEVDNTMPPSEELQPSDVERQLLREWVLSGAKITPMAAGKPVVPSIYPFRAPTRRVFSVAISPDGKHVAVGGSRTVRLSNVSLESGGWKTNVEGKVSDLVFAVKSDRLFVAVGQPGVTGRAVALDRANGKLTGEFAGHTDAVYAVALNPAESLLATAGYDRRILLHDLATGRIIRSMEGHNGSVFSLDFDASGDVLCSASADGTIKVWSVKTGGRLDTLSQPQAEQYCVQTDIAGRRIYAAGADNRIRVWDLVSRDRAKINPMVVSRYAHEQAITRLVISPSGSLIATSAEDGSVSIWQTWPLIHSLSLPVQSEPVSGLAFVGDSELLVSLMNGETQRYPLDRFPEPSVARAEIPAVVEEQILPVKPTVIDEVEANSAPVIAQKVDFPVTIMGKIEPQDEAGPDKDCFQFSAVAGQEIVMEVRAARDKSPLDSRIEVLTKSGTPVLRTRLQAVRDSYFTFRGKDSSTTGDFRVFNWQEMELNEFLYSDGEVVKLWLYPRGPDSGFNVYPGFGKRFTYFGTTPTAHALQAPCFIVVPRQPEEAITPNGLPRFDVYYENDDDPRREYGSDSRLTFTAAESGEYVVRLTDARGFGGPDFRYQLSLRTPNPGFAVSASTRKLKLEQGTGREIVFTAARRDGYEGPITIDASGLPPGFGFSGPITIQQEQLRAFGTLYASREASQPSVEQIKAIRFACQADGFEPQDIGGLEELALTKEPKLRVSIHRDSKDAAEPVDSNLKLSIHAGETISAIVALDRLSHTGVVSFGKEDSGRNLPHGLYVDNIGLNGLLLPADQSQREFFITAAKWVPPSTTTFYLKSSVDSVTSFPVTIEVLPGRSRQTNLPATSNESE